MFLLVGAAVQPISFLDCPCASQPAQLLSPFLLWRLSPKIREGKKTKYDETKAWPHPFLPSYPRTSRSFPTLATARLPHLHLVWRHCTHLDIRTLVFFSSIYQLPSALFNLHTIERPFRDPARHRSAVPSCRALKHLRPTKYPRVKQASLFTHYQRAKTHHLEQRLFFPTFLEAQGDLDRYPGNESILNARSYSLPPPVRSPAGSRCLCILKDTLTAPPLEIASTDTDASHTSRNNASLETRPSHRALGAPSLRFGRFRIHIAMHPLTVRRTCRPHPLPRRRRALGLPGQAG